tara:strand:+ start:27 stop:1592 length:1566 start_codon:yes stop_codon:yes gene_type:complete
MDLKIILIIIIIFLIGFILSREFKKNKLIEGDHHWDAQNSEAKHLKNEFSDLSACPKCIRGIWKAIVRTSEMEFLGPFDGLVAIVTGFRAVKECVPCAKQVAKFEQEFLKQLNKIATRDKAHNKISVDHVKEALCAILPIDVLELFDEVDCTTIPATQSKYTWADVGMMAPEQGEKRLGGPDYYYKLLGCSEPKKCEKKYVAEEYFNTRNSECKKENCTECLHYNNNRESYECTDTNTASQCNSESPVRHGGKSMPNIWCGTSRHPVCDGPVKCDGGCLFNGTCSKDIRKVRCGNKGKTWCNSIRDGGKDDTGDYVKPLSKKDCDDNKCRQCLSKEKGDNKKFECKDINKERCKNTNSIKTRWCGGSGENTAPQGEVCSEEHFDIWLKKQLKDEKTTHCSKLYKLGICEATLNNNVGFSKGSPLIKDCSSHYIDYYNNFLTECNRDGKSKKLFKICTDNQDYHVTGRGKGDILENQGTELYSEWALNKNGKLKNGWLDPKVVKEKWEKLKGPFQKNNLFKS